MNKKTVVIIVIIALVLVGLFLFRRGRIGDVINNITNPGSQPTVNNGGPMTSDAESADQVIKDIDAIDTLNIDSEFSDVDQDINSL